MRRISVLILTSALVAGCVVEGAQPSAMADVVAVAAATCVVTNDRNEGTYATLQDAVDAAEDGDTLRISGTCVGTTRIWFAHLHLVGDATGRASTVRLSGGGAGRVIVTREAIVSIRRLTITDGKARWGAGLWVRGGRVRLGQDVTVMGNTARRHQLGHAAHGGGIYNFGVLVLSGSARVRSNTAGRGGGIYNLGHIKMKGTSSITGNIATNGGGGIYSSAWVTMSDSSWIGRNAAGRRGGGMFNGIALVLRDSSSVTFNTARHGGGIYPDHDPISGLHRVHVCSDHVRISPNDPDDPPGSLPCP